MTAIASPKVSHFLGTQSGWRSKRIKIAMALRKQGWTYKVIERNWEGNGDTRWFDEILYNEKLGHCRGTGVVKLINNEWKIAHYALTMLVPNSIAADIGTQTQQAE